MRSVMGKVCGRPVLASDALKTPLTGESQFSEVSDL